MPLTEQEIAKLRGEKVKQVEKASDEIVRIFRENKGLYFTARELLERIPKELLKKDWKKEWNWTHEVGVEMILFGCKEVHSESVGRQIYFTYKKV